jgi:protein-S-isoprenylcysteine O-methyltransferase Ste14
MNELQTIVSAISLSMGVAWASGINLYATLLALGLLQLNGAIVLPSELQIVSHPLVLSAAGLMFCVEFFADKIPALDSLWDGVHTFIRIPAGAVLAAAALGEVNAPVLLAAAIVGGGVAGASHATKASTRALINTSPEPLSNWTASIAEDVAVVAGVWAAINHPWVFLLLLVAFLLFAAWLLPKLWSSLKSIFSRITGTWGAREVSKEVSP